MTLRFYNGEYRFVLVDTEVHGCTDVVRHMRWRCPSFSNINFFTIIYLAILCFFVVTPKAVIAQSTVAPVVSGNVTIETTEVMFFSYFTSTTTGDVHSSSSDTSESELENSTELPSCDMPLNGICSWRTDYINYCRNNSKKPCEECMKEFDNFRQEINGYFSAYSDVIGRFDCRNDPSYTYSVWSCEDCKKAYEDWLCATQIPYYFNENGQEIEVEPCEKFCERTEARCPYFLPQKPYCGQRTFFCKGPRKNARDGQNVTDRCFTCDFSQENDTAMSVEELGCSVYLENSTETSAASRTRGSVHSILVALTLYILVSWTLSPTVVAGT